MPAVQGHSYRPGVPIAHLSPRELFALLAEHPGPDVAEQAIECMLDSLRGTSEARVARGHFVTGFVSMHAEHNNFDLDERIHLMTLIAEEVAPDRAHRIPGFGELRERVLPLMRAALLGDPTEDIYTNSDVDRYWSILRAIRVELLEEFGEPELARLARDDLDAWMARSARGEAKLLSSRGSRN